MPQKKKIVILGSTGSIGTSTLEVVRQFPDKFEITGLTANSNIELLESQIAEFNPASVVVGDAEKANELNKSLNNRFEILSENDGLINLTRNCDYDILVSSLVGFAGLAPTIEGIKRGKRIALANKETLVSAGSLVTKLLKEYKAEMIPVDSEHSAIFQVLVGEKNDEIRKIILTASGGPFFNKSIEELESVSVESALKHPNWVMGKKITIDSASMMNKGLEVIEAHWLFNLPAEQIEVIIHPQSIIHSMVEFIDGSIKAQLSSPDMKLPIQYALGFPERFKSELVRTSFSEISTLSFYKPDFVKFKCLKLAFDSLKEGGTSACILNAANEIAVDMFLKGRTGFLQIPEIVDSALQNIENHRSPDLQTIFECDRQTREYVKKVYN